MTVEHDLLDRFLAVLAEPGEKVPTRFRPSAPGLGAPGLGARGPEAGEWGVPRRLAPNPLPCLRWLDAVAGERVASPATRGLVSFLQEHAPALAWGQTYGAADFGGRFLENYGWLEVFGARGCFPHARLAGGLLLLGPDTLYPDHRHEAEEIYLPLTGGSAWRMGTTPFQTRGPSEVVFHASNVPHAMQTFEQPLLALYLWQGGPLAQRSEIVPQPIPKPLSQGRSG